jgi:dTDP-4-dehydrorhamnose reductase
MKVLISGGKGLLAGNILPFLGERFDLAVYDIDEWDITSASRGKELMELHRPDVVLNLAAVTDVDGCEDRADLAQKVNAQGAGTVAGLCAAAAARLVHMSTDYVFDGTKVLPTGRTMNPGPLRCMAARSLPGREWSSRGFPGQPW